MVGANAKEPAKNAEGAEKGAEERAEKNAENRAKISRKISIFYKMVSILYKIDIQAVFVTIAFMIFKLLFSSEKRGSFLASGAGILASPLISFTA